MSQRKISSWIVAGHLLITPLSANPTSLFWTNCTTEVLESGHVSVEGDYYFNVFQSPHQNLALDTGANLGLFTFHDWSAEAGIEGLWHTRDPIYFNAKIGTKEDWFFEHSPSFSIGVFSVGTKIGETNDNVLNIVVGKELSDWLGTLYAAYYRGSRSMGQDRQGFMVGYEAKFQKAIYYDGQEYYKWLLDIDWCSGRNYIGGGGVGIAYNLTPHILFETGPVFFNTTQYNGRWKWAAQFFFNYPIFDP